MAFAHMSLIIPPTKQHGNSCSGSLSVRMYAIRTSVGLHRGLARPSESSIPCEVPGTTHPCTVYSTGFETTIDGAGTAAIYDVNQFIRQPDVVGTALSFTAVLLSLFFFCQPTFLP